MTESTTFKIDRSKLPQRGGKVSAPRNQTTTLAISGLGAKGTAEVPRKIKRLHVLIYGPPGTSKTVTAHSMPRTRTLDFDDGMQSVEWAIRKGILKKRPEEIVYKTILPDPSDPSSAIVINEAMDTIDEWLAEENVPADEWDKPYDQFWDTLIIDSASFLNDSAILLALHENKRLGLSKSMDLLKKDKLGVTPMRKQDWGSAGSLFMKFVQRCRTIGKNVVITAHQYEEYEDEEDGKQGRLIAIQPLLIGQVRTKLPASFDEVWYAHVTGSRTDPKYRLQTTPDPLRVLRSRIGCLDPIEEADFNKMKKKIDNFYGVDESQLWVAAHGDEEVEAAALESVTLNAGI
jgi:hypothetical protein